MSLPTPNLDDLRFQDIVDQAKRLIPKYCPEWTDHNVSDPGVALIELFAWMTETVLYRVNKVPDKMYIEFMKLIGVRLDPPRAAVVPVTFYLSTPLAGPDVVEIVIPEETEVATLRTETSPPIIFTTEKPLTIRPPLVDGCFTAKARLDDVSGWVQRNLDLLKLPGGKFPFFPPQPAPGDAFYIALNEDHSQHVLALVLRCGLAGGTGSDPTNPPWAWEVAQRTTSGAVRWAECQIEQDTTGGFNRNGEIVLHMPDMAQVEIRDISAYWLRCRVVRFKDQPSNYYIVSPELEQMTVEARGGTTRARHAITVHNEVLGRSDGQPGQQFRLLHTPILERDPDREFLIVEPAGGQNDQAERWQEVIDFAESTQDSRHYTLDSLNGVLSFGPRLRQANGQVFSYGAVPPKGSLLRFNRYRHGGGVTGNVARGAIQVTKTSLPYVARVTNREPAQGGLDAQSIEDARLKTPLYLRTRTRAVTADDFEYLACQVDGVIRARCLAPGAQPDEPNAPPPGKVTVLILPRTEQPRRALTLAQVKPSAELLKSVYDYLEQRCVLGISLDVRAPQFVWVSIQATLRLPEQHDPAMAADVRLRAEAALNHYLNPYIGGPGRNGWPFGRALHMAEIYSLLQAIAGVEFVEDVQIMVSEPGSASRPQSVAPRLTIPPDALICPGQHQIRTES